MDFNYRHSKTDVGVFAHQKFFLSLNNTALFFLQLVLVILLFRHIHFCHIYCPPVFLTNNPRVYSTHKVKTAGKVSMLSADLTTTKTSQIPQQQHQQCPLNFSQEGDSRNNSCWLDTRPMWINKAGKCWVVFPVSLWQEMYLCSFCGVNPLHPGKIWNPTISLDPICVFSHKFHIPSLIII